MADRELRREAINRISICHHRSPRVKPATLPENAPFEYVIWDYAETLAVDRATNSIEHVCRIGTGCKITRKHELESGIDILLDGYDADTFFSVLSGRLDDVIEDPDQTSDYVISIDYESRPQRVISGRFDRDGLPKDYPEFAKDMFKFTHFYGIGEVLVPAVYGKTLRCRSEYVFCSVVFEGSYKSYFYIADDDDIRVGDYVVVPAGRENKPAIVEVVAVEYYSAENAPLPVEKTKHIIRKCTNDDFDDYGDMW